MRILTAYERVVARRIIARWGLRVEAQCPPGDPNCFNIGPSSSDMSGIGVSPVGSDPWGDLADPARANDYTGPPFSHAPEPAFPAQGRGIPDYVHLTPADYPNLPGGANIPATGPPSTGQEDPRWAEPVLPKGGTPPAAAPKGTPVPGAAGDVPLVQLPNGRWTSPNPAWADLINRESGGNPSIEQQGCDANGCPGDPNTSRGLFQFTPSTWANAGGGKYGPDPGKATPQQQADIAGNLITMNPSGRDWGAGLPGRENAQELLQGLIPAAPAPAPSMPQATPAPTTPNLLPTPGATPSGHTPTSALKGRRILTAYERVACWHGEP